MAKTEEQVIYLDNAATSWPKPPEMMEAMIAYNDNIGASAGRGAYRRAVDSARIIFNLREALAKLFNLPASERVIFTFNCTEGLNTVLWGLLAEGDHCLISSMEHNSVIRPMRALAKYRRVEFDIVPADGSGLVDAQGYKKAIKPNTKLLVLVHGSNVAGTVQPVAEVGRIAKEAGVHYLVDAAQTAGAMPIDVQAENIEMLAFPGHKALMGPLGTGGLYIAPTVELRPLYQGGTGTHSYMEEQPEFMPDRFESGSHNALGLAGFLASVGFIARKGVEEIRNHRLALTEKMIEGVSRIPGVNYHGNRKTELQNGVISLTFDGADVGRMGERLDKEFGIMVRTGLHCAPLAHKTLGTMETGTVRFSVGVFNTPEQIDAVIDACRRIA